MTEIMTMPKPICQCGVELYDWDNVNGLCKNCHTKMLEKKLEKIEKLVPELLHHDCSSLLGDGCAVCKIEEVLKTEKAGPTQNVDEEPLHVIAPWLLETGNKKAE